jgi:hypothetical protein
VSVDPERTNAIRNFPPPSDVKGVARFIGMVNFFHKFIPKFAESAAPLNLVRKKDVQFVSGPDQQRASEDLRVAIINPPAITTVTTHARTVNATGGRDHVTGTSVLYSKNLGFQSRPQTPVS